VKGAAAHLPLARDPQRGHHRRAVRFNNNLTSNCAGSQRLHRQHATGFDVASFLLG
jgi:hypothetical protein